MFRTAFVVLAMMACTQARPQNQFQFPQFGIPSATGQSNSGVTSGETFTPHGSSTIKQLAANTGGTANNGGTNFGTAGANTAGSNGLLGKGSVTNTGAESVQQTGLPGFPHIPVIPNFPNFGFGSATGQANSAITQGKTQNPDGSTTTISMHGSSAGGSASNGGSSVNKASSSSANVDTIHGSQSTSNVDTLSTQNTGR